jgi:hypothetical protein
MTLTDTWLLVKKILLGIVVTAVPLAIIAGGLCLTRHVASGGGRTSSAEAAHHAN